MSMMPPPPPPGMIPPPGYQPYGMAGGMPTNYAGFGARLGAVLIDGLIGGLFALPGVVALLAGPRHRTACTINNVRGTCNVPTGPTIALAILLYAVGIVAFMVVYCKKVSNGQSWGHKVTGIRIVDANTGQSISAGKVFGRQVARILSGFFCGLGYLWMLWDGRKQTFHDKIVGTVVIKA